VFHFVCSQFYSSSLFFFLNFFHFKRKELFLQPSQKRLLLIPFPVTKVNVFVTVEKKLRVTKATLLRPRIKSTIYYVDL
jgi:hypothetical protein